MYRAGRDPGALCAGHVTCAVPAAVDGRRRAAAGRGVCGRSGSSAERSPSRANYLFCHRSLFYVCQYTSPTQIKSFWGGADSTLAISFQ